MRRTPLSRTSPLPPGSGPSRHTPLRSVSARARESRDGTAAAGQKTAATRRTAAASGRAESFPPAVAALIDARDPWCVKCGTPYDLHRHHRRLKGSGGDPRAHAQCACNGLRLCAGCHLGWAHAAGGRREAEAEGVIISRSETRPWTQPVTVHTEEDSGFTGWPTCEGGWVFEAPAVAA